MAVSVGFRLRGVDRDTPARRPTKTLPGNSFEWRAQSDEAELAIGVTAALELR